MTEKERERLLEKSVLPMALDDGREIYVEGVAGGDSSTRGVPNELTLAIEGPQGRKVARFVLATVIDESP